LSYFFCPFSGTIQEFTCQNRETVPTPEGRLGHGTDLVHLAGGHEKMIYSAVTHGIMKYNENISKSQKCGVLKEPGL